MYRCTFSHFHALILKTSSHRPQTHPIVLSTSNYLGQISCHSCVFAFSRFREKMVFVCPHCKKRKDNRKRSNQTCSDCFNEDQLHQQGKKTQEEERNEWQESVRKKEEEIIVVQKKQEKKTRGNHEARIEMQNDFLKQEGMKAMMYEIGVSAFRSFEFPERRDVF